MEPHPESARLCLEARIAARDIGERSVVFSPFLTFADGVPITKLTLKALRADGQSVGFKALLLRHLGQAGYLMSKLPAKTANGVPEVTYRFERSGEPATLELLASMPADAVEINVRAEDEFKRKFTARWPA